MRDNILYSSKSVIFAALWFLLSATSIASAQTKMVDARPLAIGTSIIRQPAGPVMNRLSGNSYYLDWNVSPNFGIEGKFEQAGAPPCNTNADQIMNYKLYQVGLQRSFSMKFLQPSATAYFGSGWVTRRQAGVPWHQPNTASFGLAVGFDANIMEGSSLRVRYQASRWVPLWGGNYENAEFSTTSKNTNNISVGLVHRFNSSFGREWKLKRSSADEDWR